MFAFFFSQKQFFGHYFIFIANFSIKNSQMKYVTVTHSRKKMPLHAIARVVHISLQYDNGFVMICHEQRSIIGSNADKVQNLWFHFLLSIFTCIFLLIAFALFFSKSKWITGVIIQHIMALASAINLSFQLKQLLSECHHLSFSHLPLAAVTTAQHWYFSRIFNNLHMFYVSAICGPQIIFEVVHIIN